LLVTRESQIAPKTPKTPTHSSNFVISRLYQYFFPQNNEIPLDSQLTCDGQLTAKFLKISTKFSQIPDN
jgi:hypothetical protein